MALPLLPILARLLAGVGGRAGLRALSATATRGGRAGLLRNAFAQYGSGNASAGAGESGGAFGRLAGMLGRRGASVGQRAFSEVVASSPRFGDVMGGRVSPESVQQQDNEDQANAAKEEANSKLRLLAGGAAGLQLAFLKLPGIMGRFGDSILRGQEHLRRFNGQINTAFARLERQSIELNLRQGRATSGTTSILAAEQMRFREEFQEIRQVATGIWNLVGTGVTWLARMGTVIIKWNPLFIIIEWLLEQIEKNTREGQEGPPWNGFLRDIAAGRFSGLERDRRTPRDGGRR